MFGKKLGAILVAGSMLLTPAMPAFGANNTKEYTAYQNARKALEKKKKGLLKSYETARSQKLSAQNTCNKAKTTYNNAVTNRKNAEATLKKYKSSYNTDLEKQKTAIKELDAIDKQLQEYKSAYEKAQDDYDKVVEWLEGIHRELQETESELGSYRYEQEKLQTQFDGIVSEIEVLSQSKTKNENEIVEKKSYIEEQKVYQTKQNNTLATKKKGISNYENQINNLQKQISGNSWKKYLTSEESKLYARFDKEYQKGALGFFEWAKKKNLPEAKEAISILKDKRRFSSYTKMGKTGDATNLDNMKQALNVVGKQMNTYRKKENSIIMKVSLKQVAISQKQRNASVYRSGHSNMYTGWELLTWGYSDPFDYWYKLEKKNYYTLKKKGYNLNKILSNHNHPEFNFLAHYATIKKREGYYFGFSKAGTSYPYFGTTISQTGKGMSVSQYETYFNEYYNSVAGRRKILMDRANKRMKAKKTKINSQISAKKNSISSWKKDIQILNTRISTSKRGIAQAEERIGYCEEQIELETKNIEGREAKKSELQEELDAKAEQIESKQAELEDKNREKDKKESEKVVLEGKVSATMDARDKSQRSYNTKKILVDSYKTCVDADKSLVSSQTTRVADYKKKEASAKSDYNKKYATYKTKLNAYNQIYNNKSYNALCKKYESTRKAYEAKK